MNSLDSKIKATTPFFPVHPGSILGDELEARGITQVAFAKDLQVAPSYLNEIINEKRAINTEMALMLEARLGISAEFWLKMQGDYNMQVAKSNPSFMERLASLRKIAAVF